MTSLTRLIVDMISGVYKVQSKNYKNIIWGEIFSLTLKGPLSPTT